MHACLVRNIKIATLCTALFLSGGLAQAQVGESRSPATIDLSAEASRTAANDLAQASAYFEATDPDPATLSVTVNKAIQSALETAKQYPDVKVGTSGISTWPVYARNGQTIEAWRMRSAISLESQNIPALSELLGKLQQTLAITNLVMMPSAATRNAAADLAATDAIRAFEERAASLSSTLGKRYRLKHLSVNYGGGHGPIYPMMRSNMVAMEAAAPAPLEGGESEINVNVNGTIELLD